MYLPKPRWLLVPAGALLVSCGSGNTAAGNGSKTITFKPGIVISLTGDLSAFGPSYVQVDKMAIADLNKAIDNAGASGKYAIRLTGVEDDQTQASAATEAAKKLIAAGSDVIVGSLGSTTTIAMAKAATIPGGVMQVAPGATSVALTSLPDQGLVFRTVPSDDLTARAMVAQLGKTLGANARVNIGVRNDAFGAGFQSSFTRAWTAAGGTVGANIKWDPTQATFDTEAQQLVAGSPDAWVIIDFPVTWAKLGPALVRTGKWSAAKTFTNQGLNSPDLPKLAGKQATEGLNGIDPTSVGPAAEELSKRFEQQNAKLPYDAFAPNNYDAVVVPFLSMVAAGSDKSADMAKAMTKVTKQGAKVYTNDQLSEAIKALEAGDSIDYQGPAGPMHFDDKGDPRGGAFETFRIKAGKIATTSNFTFSK